MEVATAFVTIRPETSGFESELASALGGAEPVDVPVGADVEEAQGEIDSLDGGVVEVPVGADVEQAQGEIDSLSGGSVSVDVSANTEQAQASISSLSGAVETATGALGDLGDGAGGAGGALSGMASAALQATGASAALATGVGALAVGIGVSVDSAMDAEVVQAKLAAVLQTTGAAAYVTQDALNANAEAIMNYSGQSDEAIGSAQALLLTFEGVSNEASINAGVLDRATRSTADIAALMGGDASSAALRLGRALDSPTVGLSMLQRSGVSFTQAQKDAITALEESGDMVGAQSALLDVVEGQVGGVAEAYGDTLAGQIDLATEKFDNIKEEMGNSFLPTIKAVVGPTLDLADAISTAASAAGLFTGPLSSMRESLDAGGVEGYTAQLLVGGPLLNDWSRSADAAAKAAGALTPEMDKTADSLGEINRNIDQYVNALFGLPGAQRNLQASFAELTAAMTATEPNWNDQAVAMEGVVASTAATIAKQQEFGATTAELDATIYGSIATLAQMRDQGIITGAQFDTLSQQIRDVPHQATTEVSAPGADGAIRQLREVRTVVDGIPRSVVVQVSVPALGAIAADVAGAAAQLRSLRNIEAATAAGADLDRSSASTVAPTRITLVNQLDGQTITERVFDIDRRMAMAEGYEPA